MESNCSSTSVRVSSAVETRVKMKIEGRSPRGFSCFRVFEVPC